MTMRIGIDLSIVKVNRAGSGLYAAGLFDALQQIDHEDEFRVFSAPRYPQAGSLRRKIENFYHDLAWKHAVLPIQAARAGLNVLHETNFITPLVNVCPTVVTILDVSVLKMPDYFSRWFRNYARLLIPQSARGARRILTISEFSKQEIVTLLGVPPEKVVVTYPDVSPRFRPLPESQTTPVLNQYNLDRPYILSVCTLEPRKNILRLVQAFAQLKARGFPHRLVHVGARGWQYADILNEVERFKLGQAVVFLNHVPLNDLVALLNRAAVFAYPSLYEGFGLPVLEAMRCGCPVITSNGSSLPEVIGDGGVLIDPLSVEGIASALKSVLADEGKRAVMRERGLQNAARFSWERCARETLNVYRSIGK